MDKKKSPSDFTKFNAKLSEENTTDIIYETVFQIRIILTTHYNKNIIVLLYLDTAAAGYAF